MTRVAVTSGLVFWVGATLLLSRYRWFARRPLADRLGSPSARFNSTDVQARVSWSRSAGFLTPSAPTLSTISRATRYTSSDMNRSAPVVVVFMPSPRRQES